MSRRRRSSPVEDLFELAARLPWWLCLILAVISYAVLHPIAVAPVAVNPAPGQMGTMVTDMVWRSFAGVGQYALPIVLAGAAVASFFGRRKREALARNVADSASGGALRSMNWQDFELLVGEAFRLRGYTVTETGGGGASTTSWRVILEMADAPSLPSAASRLTSLTPTMPPPPMTRIFMLFSQVSVCRNLGAITPC